ncbi:MAG: sigma-70 family RNA polymerase sigma factor [Duncaniella sp.]|nr:sigma-70 family RNA polymerase sigma factor [Duncaniella sp.]
MSSEKPDIRSREERFYSLIDANKPLLVKVCYMFATDAIPFNDLYQEVLLAIWSGLDTFRGDSRASTWLYHVAFITCISVARTSRRHIEGKVPIEVADGVHSEDADRPAMLKKMYRLISGLPDIDKSIILMWLDEQSYDEISQVTGMSRNTIATRLRRIKQRLSERNKLSD